MPTVYALKPRFQAALRPFVGRLAAAGITANQVTVAAAAGSLAIGLLVATSVEQRTMFLLLPLWLLARMALNAIDGMLTSQTLDLPANRHAIRLFARERFGALLLRRALLQAFRDGFTDGVRRGFELLLESGRASCRERV